MKKSVLSLVVLMSILGTTTSNGQSMNRSGNNNQRTEVRQSSRQSNQSDRGFNTRMTQSNNRVSEIHMEPVHNDRGPQIHREHMRPEPIPPMPEPMPPMPEPEPIHHSSVDNVVGGMIVGGIVGTIIGSLL